ncbi:DUF6246 family protein [Eoetvoesiella caeni]|nr:DUF6246 family protein [Eoetvoesiella caeni]MCI2809393.1 DUF6246 family protein [Eoetvoesiella caeni]NYT54534.1 hypothetical protein [Eoetvoesiella caeni]
MAGDLQDALAVIFACCEADLSAVFGCFESTEAGLKYVAGSAPQEHVVPLAQCLMKHGITGALEPLPRRHDEDPEYVVRFLARDHVALAMAHLGMSEKDAWNMTMTSLVGALRAKFPQQESNAPGARAPSKEEHEATMEWFDKIEAKRKAAQGAH